MSCDYKQYGDQLLFQELSNDNQAAFDEIYSRYSSVIFKTAYNILRDRADAEDVVQEIFLTLWRRRKELQIQSLGAYLKQSAWYLAIRVQKEQKKDTQFYNRLKEISTEISQEDPTLFKEFKAVLEKVISELPPDESAMLKYSREQNMTHGQIAQHLNIHQKKVERKISQALQRIRIQLDNWLLVLLLFLTRI